MARWPMAWICGTCLTAGLLLPIEQPQALRPRLLAEEIFVNAPDLRIIEGKIAEKLKNGTAVAFDYHLALFTGSRTVARRRTFERFSFSYDLWEENYTVSSLRKPRSAASRMTAREAERWCLDHLPMLATGLDKGEEFWLRLEIRAAQTKNDAEWLSEDGLNLGRLIDALGRVDERKPDQWVREAGPFRLRDFPASGRIP